MRLRRLHRACRTQGTSGGTQARSGAQANRSCACRLPNELRKAGVPLLEAIHEAGRRRLRPIIMTSLTTIFGMVPLLFTFDLGSELQKPLSIAMIAAMLIGTAVSLFVIPLVYWFIYRKHA